MLDIENWAFVDIDNEDIGIITAWCLSSSDGWKECEAGVMACGTGEEIGDTSFPVESVIISFMQIGLKKILICLSPHPQHIDVINSKIDWAL